MADLSPAPMFQWTEEYAVGVDDVDREHQQLFALAESLHQAMLAGQGKERLNSLLADLVDYTGVHFSHEERLMERIGYSDMQAHQGQHNDLRSRLRAMRDRSALGEKTMTIEVAQFLVEWLKQHTTTSDRRIGEHLKAIEAATGRRSVRS